MKICFVVLVVAHFAFLVVFGQITFTREWVTGKKSSGPSGLDTKDSRGQRLFPTLEQLLKSNPLMTVAGYGGHKKRVPLPWRNKNGGLNSLGENPMNEDQSGQYDMNQKYSPIISLEEL